MLFCWDDLGVEMLYRVISKKRRRVMKEIACISIFI